MTPLSQVLPARAPPVTLAATPTRDAVPTERVTFDSHTGDTLAARLDLPDGPRLGAACSPTAPPAGEDIPAARRRRRAAWPRWALPCSRFDFTGLGHSEGE